MDISTLCSRGKPPPLVPERLEGKKSGHGPLFQKPPNPSNRVVSGAAGRKRRGISYKSNRTISPCLMCRSHRDMKWHRPDFSGTSTPPQPDEPPAPTAVYGPLRPALPGVYSIPDLWSVPASERPNCRLSAINLPRVCNRAAAAFRRLDIRLSGEGRSTRTATGDVPPALMASAGNFHSELRLKPALPAAARPIRAITTFTVSHMHSSAAGITPMPSLRR